MTVRRLLVAAATALVAVVGAGCSADDAPDAGATSASPSVSSQVDGGSTTAIM